jgi:hypothetical protein
MKYALGFAMAFAATLAFAQQSGIGAIKVEPSPARAGQEVRITISAEGDAPVYCGMEVHFGDGSDSRNVKIGSNDLKFPVTITKTYDKPRTYAIKAEGKKVTNHLKCMGKAKTTLVVEAPPAAAKPAAAVECPQGYKMTGKAGKAGDFSCKGGKGAKAPAKPLACAEGLEYFANDKSQQLGCRKTKAQKK